MRRVKGRFKFNYKNNKNSTWMSFRCPRCGNPALPVPGMYIWCPKCSWVPKVKNYRNHAIF